MAFFNYEKSQTHMEEQREAPLRTQRAASPASWAPLTLTPEAGAGLRHPNISPAHTHILYLLPFFPYLFTSSSLEVSSLEK